MNLFIELVVFKEDQSFCLCDDDIVIFLDFDYFFGFDFSIKAYFVKTFKWAQLLEILSKDTIFMQNNDITPPG